MVYALFILLCIFQALDAWHTYLLIQTGVIEEAMPTVAWCMEQFGVVTGMVMIKVVTMSALLITIILWERRKRHG